MSQLETRNTPQTKPFILPTWENFLKDFCNWDDTRVLLQLDLINADILEQKKGMLKEMQIKETKSNPLKCCSFCPGTIQTMCAAFKW